MTMFKNKKEDGVYEFARTLSLRIHCPTLLGLLPRRRKDKLRGNFLAAFFILFFIKVFLIISCKCKWVMIGF